MPLFIYITCASEDEAERIASALLDERLIAMIENAFGDVRFERLAHFKGEAFHRERGFEQRRAQIEPLEGDLLPACVHAGQHEQVLHQIVHAADF